MFKRQRSVPGHNGQMEIAEHVDALSEYGRSLATGAERAGLDAPVPPCLPWRVKDLLRHVGYIHRWAAKHITDQPAEVVDGPPEEEILKGGAPDGELLAWFRDGHAMLVELLRTADPDLRTAVLMPGSPSPLAFWARRQAHETAIHRADAECAAGLEPAFASDFAADGIDELIMGFGRRRKYQPSAAGQPGGDPAVGKDALRIATTDTGHAWYAEARDGRLHPRRAAGTDAAAGCAVTGPASGLYLYLWNRADAARAGVQLDGDPALLTCWQSAVRVRWS